MPLGPAQSYLAKYNDYTLPGYVQNESIPSSMNIGGHQAPYADGSRSEYTGLNNKQVSVTLKVWEQDYATCKEQVRLASTILRSKKEGTGILFIQKSDRYFKALTAEITEEKAVGESMRTLDYTATFECMPWLYSTSGYTVSGIGVINTDQVSRSIYDGTWTPANVRVTGSNITISGYTATGDFTGFISVSGVVQNLRIDSDNYTATVSGVNMNSKMLWADYALFVGPGKTYFDINGATSCEITYNNRWNL